MGAKTRKELVERLRHAVVEGEAAFWAKVKELFPEAQQGVELPPKVIAGLWNVLDGVTQAWAIQHVPGMVEALANEQADRLEMTEPRDERDQT